MHREIQIKQFPIVTTHWWPKTRNERLCEKTNSIYIVFYLLYTTMSKWSECAHASAVCVCVCVRRAWRRACLKRGADATFSSANGGVSQSDRLMQIPNPVHATPAKYVMVVVTMTAPLVSCLRPSMCSYDGELFNLISLCMFFSLL